jgi:hypothetical protein
MKLQCEHGSGSIEQQQGWMVKKKSISALNLNSYSMKTNRKISILGNDRRCSRNSHKV